MSGSFELTLDTTAPRVTWGAWTGVAGERFKVGYLLDEPAVDSAELELADGRILPLVDTGTTLECDLPPDTPNGNATVRVVVVDDVLNQATWTHIIPIGGVVVIPEPGREAMVGLPKPAPRRRPRTTRRLRATSTVRVSSRAAVAHQATPRKVEIGVSTLRSRMSSRRVASSRGEISATSRVIARRESTGTIRTLSREGTVTRRDGPDLEALLLL